MFLIVIYFGPSDLSSSSLIPITGRIQIVMLSFPMHMFCKKFRSYEAFDGSLCNATLIEGVISRKP